MKRHAAMALWERPWAGMFAGKTAPARSLGTAAILTALLLGCSGAAHGAELMLTQPWYRVELIVFERLTEPATGELLNSDTPRRFPRDILAFDEDRSPYYTIDPQILDLPAVFPADPRYNAPLPDRRASRFTDDEELAPAPFETTVPARTKPALTELAPSPTPAQALTAAIQDFEAQLEATSLTWLPRSALQLNTEARRLGARGTFRVLLHGAFHQWVPNRDTPIPLLIQAGDRYGDRWSIEGTISVTLARFLHAHAQLWRAPFADQSDVQVLDEHRRMRSGELHYLDHPAFGVLIRIDPVAPPQVLIDQAAAVD